MVLAHLVGTDKTYTDFFKNLEYKEPHYGIVTSYPKHYKILDNSVIEGQQVSIEELCKKAVMIDAQEIILPDVLKDSKATLKTSYEAYLYVKQHYPWLNMMAVPQGKDLTDWSVCAREMLRWDIQAIGVPKLLTKDNGLNARIFALQSLITIGDWNHQGPADVHLLGCGETPLELTLISNLIRSETIPDMVRSCDSAIAYVYSKAGKLISEGARPANVNIDFSDVLDDAHIEIFNTNYKLWQNSIKQEQPKIINLFN